jgi:hypothetical protein
MCCHGHIAPMRNATSPTLLLGQIGVAADQFAHAIREFLIIGHAPTCGMPSSSVRLSRSAVSPNDHSQHKKLNALTEKPEGGELS